ncbi:hypothetical protein, partial [Clostridium perfringens]
FSPICPKLQRQGDISSIQRYSALLLPQILLYGLFSANASALTSHDAGQLFSVHVQLLPL